MKIISTNKKARHNYNIESTVETGIVLVGTEVKSIRAGRVNFKDSYATIDNEEVYLRNLHISPYKEGNIFNVDSERKRKLLLHKKEIRKLIGYISQDRYTLVPVDLHFNKKGFVKVTLGIATGKKLYDKRADLAKKDAQRDIERSMKNRY